MGNAIFLEVRMLFKNKKDAREAVKKILGIEKDLQSPAPIAWHIEHTLWNYGEPEPVDVHAD